MLNLTCNACINVKPEGGGGDPGHMWGIFLNLFNQISDLQLKKKTKNKKTRSI